MRALKPQKRGTQTQHPVLRRALWSDGEETSSWTATVRVGVWTGKEGAPGPFPLEGGKWGSAMLAYQFGGIRDWVPGAQWSRSW